VSGGNARVRKCHYAAGWAPAPGLAAALNMTKLPLTSGCDYDIVDIRINVLRPMQCHGWIRVGPGFPGAHTTSLEEKHIFKNE
jgi:hypothetical protein